MQKYLIVFLIVLVLAVSSCATTVPASSSVPESVNRYLLKNGTDFDEYRVSDLEAEDGFGFNEKEYNVYEDPDTVWRDYCRTDPGLAFDSTIIDFGVVYNPADSVVYSRDDPFLPRFSEGQIYILDLKFLGIYSIPIGFKVSRIDPEEKVIEFIYLKENVCNGYQRICLNPGYDEEGTPVTHIVHSSYFTSEHPLRDKLFYPPFHEQTIDDFHENVFKLNGLAWENLK